MLVIFTNGLVQVKEGEDGLLTAIFSNFQKNISKKCSKQKSGEVAITRIVIAKGELEQENELVDKMNKDPSPKYEPWYVRKPKLYKFKSKIL